MKKLAFTAYLLTLGGFAFAQVPEGAGLNLVPNPSFEDKKKDASLPKEDLDGSASFRQAIAEWNSPTLTTPDWFIVPKNKIQEAKKKGQIINEARTGIKMVGILTHNSTSERSTTYREYLQVKLPEPTKKGQEYYFEMWVCQDVKAKQISNNLGFVLSPTPVFRQSESNKYEPLTDMKPDFNYTELINEKERGWQRISVTFIAANRAQYLIIGNFFDNKNTKFKDVARGGDNPQPYYLIDDVALHEVNPIPVAIPEPEPVFVPEPVTLVEEPMEVGKVIELDHVYFETSKWKLLEESTSQLTELVDLMNKYPTMEIEIGGHTDDRGTDAANQKLSENRTKSVYEFLASKGVEAARMSYNGYGEKSPKTTNDTEENRAQNRRVEFKVTKIDDKVDVNIKNDNKSYNGGDK
jgi:OmpA-OmpF porin, OOP family